MSFSFLQFVCVLLSFVMSTAVREKGVTNLAPHRMQEHLDPEAQINTISCSLMLKNNILTNLEDGSHQI